MRVSRVVTGVVWVIACMALTSGCSQSPRAASKPSLAPNSASPVASAVTSQPALPSGSPEAAVQRYLSAIASGHSALALSLVGSGSPIAEALSIDARSGESSSAAFARVYALRSIGGIAVGPALDAGVPSVGGVVTVPVHFMRLRSEISSTGETLPAGPEVLYVGVHHASDGRWLVVDEGDAP